MAKLTYFMAMIDGVFCLVAGAVYKCKTLSVVTFELSEIMGIYSIPDTIIKD